MAKLPRRSKLLPKGALIEFVRRGGYLRVSAMDPVTLTEAVIVGNPRAGEANLRKVAIAKLEMQLQKKMAQSQMRAGTYGNKARNFIPRTKRPEPKSGWDF